MLFFTPGHARDDGGNLLGARLLLLGVDEDVQLHHALEGVEFDVERL